MRRSQSAATKSVNGNVAAGQVAAGGVTVTEMDGEEVEDEWTRVTIVGHVYGEAHVCSVSLTPAGNVRLVPVEGEHDHLGGMEGKRCCRIIEHHVADHLGLPRCLLQSHTEI